MQTIIAIVIIFGLIIAIHEMGHLIMAKRAGILCREFAIGFGPKLFSIRKYETIYTVRLLPIGGFVRMAGEDPETIEVKPGHHIGLLFNEAGKIKQMVINNKSKHPQARMITVEEADLERDLYIKGRENEEDEVETFQVDEKADFISDEQFVQNAPRNRQFNGRPVGSRLLAIFAGPFMNFLLAFILFLVFAAIQGVPSDKALLGKVVDDSPAMKAGLESGDQVVGVNGNPVHSWDEFTSVIQKNPGNEVQLKVNRNDQQLKVAATPKKRKLESGEVIGQLGVQAELQHSLLGTIQYGFSQTVEVFHLIFQALGQMITGQVGIDGLSGPVGIVSVTGEVAQQGVLPLINFAAFLSINVGLLNLLPVPALDGGRLIFLLFEAVRGKPVDPNKEALIHFVGFALLFLLMIAVTWNDIQRFFLH